MKTGILSLISHMLMDEDQLVTIQKLFNTMDKSGEGTLDKDELKMGFENICEYHEGDEKFHSMSGDKDKYIELIGSLKKIDEQRVEMIIKSTDIDDNGKMDFMDFMMAAVDLSEDQFLKYCESAYEIFFNNDIQ